MWRNGESVAVKAQWAFIILKKLPADGEALSLKTTLTYLIERGEVELVPSLLQTDNDDHGTGRHSACYQRRMLLTNPAKTSSVYSGELPAYAGAIVAQK